MFPALWSSIKIVSLIFVAGACFTAIAQETSSRPVLDIDGNKVFSKQELLDIANQCLDRNTQSREYETAVLDYCLDQVAKHLRQKGYLQATLGKTLYNQNETVLKATIPVSEGPLFRIGEIKIDNAKVLSPAQIIEMIGLNPGDIADGEKLANAVFERAKQAYGSFGYIQYTAEISPTFRAKEGAADGVVDILITVDEGRQFKLRSIKFEGADSKTTEMLRRELMVRDGEVFNADLFANSIIRINNTGLYAPVDANKDVYFRTEEKAAYVEVTIRLKKRGEATEAANP